MFDQSRRDVLYMLAAASTLPLWTGAMFTNTLAAATLSGWSFDQQSQSYSSLAQAILPSDLSELANAEICDFVSRFVANNDPLDQEWFEKGARWLDSYSLKNSGPGEFAKADLTFRRALLGSIKDPLDIPEFGCQYLLSIRDLSLKGMFKLKSRFSQADYGNEYLGSDF